MRNRCVYSRYCYTDAILNFLSSYSWHSIKSISRFSPPFTSLTAQARVYRSLWTGFLLIPYRYFQIPLCPAARVSDAEHNLHHTPPLPKTFDGSPPFSSLQRPGSLQRDTQGLNTQFFPTSPDTMQKSSVSYTDLFSVSVFLFVPPSCLCRMLCYCAEVSPNTITFPTPHPVESYSFFKTQTLLSQRKPSCYSDPGQVSGSGGSLVGVVFPIFAIFNSCDIGQFWASFLTC